ncbi:DAK2 domain-containing protein, partial [Micromonospora rifamycinica]|uniref:DAK2 domain-containing protein n=1 Tax=Micromonospora rifamycinica TaxID=291594 RepID=UPI0033F5FDE8
DLRAVTRAAAGAATRALARTPEQLPALAHAGVVDAGGRGLCLLLDALVEVVTGESPPEPTPVVRPARPPLTGVRETGSPEYAYEVQFLLDAPHEAVTRLRATLATLGDSLVVVGDGGSPAESTTWNVHVHVNDVGAAVEAGVAAGRPYRISVTRFAEQAAAPGAEQAAAPGAEQAAAPGAEQAAAPGAEPAVDLRSVPVAGSRAAVVVAAGVGIAELFGGEGATVVPGNPSTGELLDAIRATAAARVVVLPNDPDTQAVASAAAREAHRLGVRVSVVPTRSPVQALAALAVRDPQRRFEDDVIAMAEAAGACRYAEVCHASREALTVAGPCRPGDVLALVEGEVHLIGSDLVDTCAAVVDRMLGGGGELVTLLTGADAPTGLAEAVRAHIGQRWPFVEVQAYPGGQPHYPLLVGVE